MGFLENLYYIEFNGSNADGEKFTGSGNLSAGKLANLIQLPDLIERHYNLQNVQITELKKLA